MLTCEYNLYPKKSAFDTHNFVIWISYDTHTKYKIRALSLYDDGKNWYRLYHCCCWFQILMSSILRWCTSGNFRTPYDINVLRIECYHVRGVSGMSLDGLPRGFNNTKYKIHMILVIFSYGYHMTHTHKIQNKSTLVNICISII